MICGVTADISLWSVVGYIYRALIYQGISV